MKQKIKLFDPFFDKNEKLAINKVLKSHHWASGSGEGYVNKFEEKFKKFVGAASCIAVNSGTAALHLALSLQSLKNCEVLLPSLTFASTAHAVVHNGGIPVFVDVEPDTLCIDPEKIKKRITKKTKVILPVHFGGIPCNLDEILSLCNKHNLVLIEDAAHAAGTKFNNKKIGSHGNSVCFSFHPVKNIAMPGGGAITLNGKNTDKITKKLKSRRWCGISNRKGVYYDIDDLGWNYYMNEFSAAIGLEQLKKIKKMNSKRKTIAKRYFNEIGLDKKMPYSNNCSYHLYWIRVSNRSEFMKKMNKKNIETGIHYNPLHTMTFFKNNTKLKNTEKITKEIVSIPMHPNLSNTQVDRVIKITNKYAKE